jgi:hypothetical protein
MVIMRTAYFNIKKLCFLSIECIVCFIQFSEKTMISTLNPVNKLVSIIKTQNVFKGE